ncbi:MAG: thioesterase family protein [Pseudomonadota bacterium]
MAQDQIRSRSQYAWFTTISSRWRDNDIYGHVNNVVHYSYFDTVANTFLIEEGRLDIHNGETIGFVVSSNCDYFEPIAFPDALEGGLRVNTLGNSSVEYGIAIFKKGAELAASAGTFTHVFVDRQSQRPVAIAGEIRRALESLLGH